ncbi:MAG: OmpA family protein [Verrucomicrobia bacterium]|nr:OmpA family protein [Verrucomicrobiota bacterium]
MKLVSKKLCLVLAGTALVFAGCAKKPIRPDPNATLGPTGGGENIAPPQNLSTVSDLDSKLAPKDDFDPLTGMNRTALAGSTVYFEFDQSSIKPSEREKLKAAKDYLALNPGMRIMLEGHCDWRGTAEYNLGLGDRRANAVKKYLISIGVAADKLEANSKGSLEAKPNADAATMEKDRRVDLILIKAAGGAGLGAPAASPTPLK